MSKHRTWGRRALIAVASVFAALVVLAVAPGGAETAAAGSASAGSDAPSAALYAHQPSNDGDTLSDSWWGGELYAGEEFDENLDGWWDDDFDEFWGEFDDELDGWWDDGFDDVWGEFDDELDGWWDDEFDDFWGEFDNDLDGWWDDEFSDEFGDEFSGGAFGSDELGTVIASYQVTNGALVGADVPAEHQALWDRFTDLIPSEYREMVAEFEIFSDGCDGVFGAVGPLDDDATEWVLSVDPADAGDPDELAATLIHEFGHLLTLNNEQIPALAADIGPFAYDQAAAACRTYFTFEGCSIEDSYLNTFVARFWADILDESNALAELDEFSDEFWDGLDEFESKYGDRFVSEYAMTDPAEDMAETFMVFVLNDRPSGSSIADEKIDFFYDYPELVSLRDAIRAAL